MFVLNKLLIISGFDAECNRTEIIKRWERSVMLKFIHDALSPVTQFGKNGYLAQIGKGANVQIKFLKVHVCNIGGDGQFLDGIGGCHCGRMIRNCRICKDTATSRVVIIDKDSIRYRDDKQRARVLSEASRSVR